MTGISLVILIFGMIFTFAFYLVWFARNVGRYMYRREYPMLTNLLWKVFLPLSIIGIALIITSIAII